MMIRISCANDDRERELLMTASESRMSALWEWMVLFVSALRSTNVGSYVDNRVHNQLAYRTIVLQAVAHWIQQKNLTTILRQLKCLSYNPNLVVGCAELS